MRFLGYDIWGGGEEITCLRLKVVSRNAHIEMTRSKSSLWNSETCPKLHVCVESKVHPKIKLVSSWSFF